MPSVAKTYEQEQEQLRAEYEGQSDIHITAPKEPEVNPEVYRDVEPLLFKGFLTRSAAINDTIFTFKSLNHHEFDMLRLSTGPVADTPNFWSIFLAYGVFMVDGVNVLVNRERWIPEIAATFRAFPASARDLIIRHLSEINRRAANAVTLTEAYATEIYSRFRWAQLRGLDLTSPSVTGIGGTDHLGMNWAQHLWRAINYYDDRNEEHEREWENAKFIGACFAGKGISKVYSQDNTRRQKDRDDKLARKDKILRSILLGEDTSDKVQQAGHAVSIVARSVEDLTAQLERDLRGEKDWHDRVVEEQENQIRTQYQARRVQLEDLVRAREAEFGGGHVQGQTQLLGLSAAEVQERILRSKQLEAQKAARQVIPSQLLDPKVEEFMGRWNLSPSEVEVGFSETDRDPSEAVPIPLMPKNPGKPFGRK